MGACEQRLVDLVGTRGRVAVIANATDAQTGAQRREAVEREFTALAALGLRPEELDLRDYFERNDVRDDLATYDAVWVRGGNVFMLRHALARSGADGAIVDLLRSDAIAYGGYSAGPCVLGHSLSHLADVDDPTVVNAIYGEPALEHGLGILDWAFVPHVDSPGHPETEACGRVAERCAADEIPHRTFRDGDVLVIDGDDEYLCSAH